MSETESDKSRTQHKKEAHELQKLGLDLARLSVDQLKQADIPPELKTAVIDFKSITSKNAARRQQQYIGALMRDVDPELIQRALSPAQDNTAPESDTDRQIRVWVDQLLSGGPDATENIIAAYPDLDRQRLRQLIRNVLNAKPGAKAKKSLETLQGALKEIISPD